MYNGADFTELKDDFKSDKFSSAVIHLPINFCVAWEKEVEINRLRTMLIANGIAPDVENPNDVEQTEIDSGSGLD